MSQTFPHIASLPSLSGKRVLVRLDIDVPLAGGVIGETFRLDRDKKTLEFLKDAGAKIIAIGHAGHHDFPDVSSVAEYLGLRYVDTLNPQLLRAEIETLPMGEGMLLKNLRSDPREVTNDTGFAQELASLGDLYVYEAFAAAHRSHASTIGIPSHLPAYLGYQCMDEVRELSKAFESPHPFVCIFGGAKADTKISLLKQMEHMADKILVGGSLANTLFKTRGYETGVSLVDGNLADAAQILKNPNVVTPCDVVACADGRCYTKTPDSVAPHENMLDVGIDTLQQWGKEIGSAQFILWNGPLGMYEAGYRDGTEQLAQIIAASKAESIVGGGDTITAISKLGLMDRFSFVSTGGGAMLDFLINKTLPALEAVRHSVRS